MLMQIWKCNLKSSIPQIVGLKINFFLQNGEFQNDINSALPHIVGFLGTSPFCWNFYNTNFLRNGEL